MATTVDTTINDVIKSPKSFIHERFLNFKDPAVIGFYVGFVGGCVYYYCMTDTVHLPSMFVCGLMPGAIFRGICDAFNVVRQRNIVLLNFTT